MKSGRLVNGVILAILFLSMLALPAVGASTAASSPSEAEARIEALVLEELAAAGETEFFVWMAEKADLSPAYALQTKLEKGQFVFDILRETAARTQAGLRRALDARGVDYQAFYIANKILVRGGDQNLVMDIAARPDVARITANHVYQLQEPFIEPEQPHVQGVESNITFINADDAWALGYDGTGTVMAGNDTGLDWDHPAIINHYRGWNGASVDHNYNWWDATGAYPTVPNDVHGHGTHTTGTMVGDDGGSNQIGVAPGAQTVHCKNMTDGGSGSDATFSTCFQWDLAPWDLNGQNANPALAPDAINNSWGYRYGNNNTFRDEILALHAAGILVEVSAGNEGPSCGTLRSPGDYWQVLTTGSVYHGTTFPGTITSFSSRGPSDLDASPPYYFPDIMAPGQSIRSSLPGGTYASWSGTSMAGPHATALVGLIWNACPALQGDVEQALDIIRSTAVPLTGQNGSNCGGDYVSGPNNDWGLGTIDAYAAVQEALTRCGDPPPSVSIVDPTQGQTISGTYRVRVSASDNSSVVSVELSIDGGGYFDITANFDGTYYFYDWDSTAVPDGDHTLQARATDDADQSNESTVVTVSVDNVNDPPVASFDYTCTDLDCTFDGSESTDPDGITLRFDWDLGDGTLITDGEPVVNHTYAAPDTYTVILTVTDDKGATDDDIQDVTVTVSPKMHVGDLDGDRITNRNKWTAIVTITVHDDGHGAVSNATVTGTWSGGTSGSGQCTTGPSGQCQISQGNIQNKVPSVVFTVDAITHSALVYDPAANHDPDGDSNGTTITVYLEPPVNQAPVATFIATCTGLACTFDGSGSDDPDGEIARFDWDLGDGTIIIDGAPVIEHTYAEPNTYPVELTVWDNEGASGSDSQSVPVGVEPGHIFVYAIDLAGGRAGPNRFATATVTIYDTTGNPASGATVYGTWSGDVGGTASGVTGADGTVSLTSRKTKQANAHFVFTVDDVVKAGFVYDEGLNNETWDEIWVP